MHSKQYSIKTYPQKFDRSFIAYNKLQCGETYAEFNCNACPWNQLNISSNQSTKNDLQMMWHHDKVS